jgi:hypothetical protein
VTGDAFPDLIGTVWGAVLGGGGMGSGQWNYASTRRARIAVLPGKAGGGFNLAGLASYPVTATTGTDAVELVVGDLDAAAGKDVMVVVRQLDTSTNTPTETWSVAAMLNNGTGTFALPASPSAALDGPWTARVVARLGDIDGDGKQDVMIMQGVPPTFQNGMYTQTLTGLFGDATGHFASPLTIATIPGPNKNGSGASGFAPPWDYADCGDAMPQAMATQSGIGELGLADLSGDGKADLFVGEGVFLSTGRALGAPGRLEGGGFGSGGGASGTGNAVVSTLLSGPLLIDVDGDNKAEVISVSVLQSGGGTIYNVSLLIGRVNPPGVHTW